jgi:hypothetical protein
MKWISDEENVMGVRRKLPLPHEENFHIIIYRVIHRIFLRNFEKELGIRNNRGENSHAVFLTDMCSILSDKH